MRELTPEERLGLLPWFLKGTPSKEFNLLLRRIINAAWGAIWGDNILRHVADAKKANDGRPRTVQELADLIDIDSVNLLRQPNKDEKRYAVACALRCPLSDLVPRKELWIKELVLGLLREKSAELDRLRKAEKIPSGWGSEDDVEVYACYIAEAMFHQGDLDVRVVDTLVGCNPKCATAESVRGAILRVAAVVGAILRVST